MNMNIYERKTQSNRFNLLSASNDTTHATNKSISQVDLCGDRKGQRNACARVIHLISCRERDKILNYIFF